ncbi:flavin reductase [Yeguia hominis]|uniref:Flavin reductase n=1 Tax=Yeguia hominis TaxID=2763662 RepID=A0A926HQR8_9FIRM|nr:flavin reductase [Yeguia hominis]MBC8532503.1 flavin reductase [Yeguia hominis]
MDPKILRALSYGMYAIGVKGKGGPSACIANTVVQVAGTTPPVIAVSIHHDNYSNACIREAGIFTVSILSEDTSGTVIGALGLNSGRSIQKLKNIRHRVLREGVPIIKESACCWMLCKVIGQVETATHTVFLAEVTAGSEAMTGTPMTYAYYRSVIKGVVPQNAPSYEEPDFLTDPETEKYICTICTYVYQNPDVLFEDLPEDWVCPICGAQKSMFKRR